MPVETNSSCESIENKNDNNWDQVINNLFHQITVSKQSDGSDGGDENEEDCMSDSQSEGGEMVSTFELFSNLIIFFRQSCVQSCF
jgi:hypothetical protein